jgi:outer membrane receptor protein involved in Fe transport
MTNNENVNRFIGGGSFTAFLQQNDFSITKLIIRGGVDYYTLATKAIFPSILQFQSDGNGTDGASIQGNTNNLNTNVSAYLVNTFGALNRRLNFTTSGGATMENFDQNQILNSASRLIGTQTNLNQASAVTVYQNRIPRKNRGLFLQEEVNFEDKIIITGGVRLDKSSDNADVNKYETFPKVSLALNVANFQFWRWKSVDLFKLRAAYGESGNFPPFGAKFTAFSNANIGGLGGTLIGVINSQGFVQRGNDQIKQERQKEFETGLDVGILGGKIAFEGTYYNRRGTDLIFTQNVPSSSGFVQKFINGGTLQNKGWEFALTISPYNTTNFKWTSRTSYWQNRSKMTRLDIPSFNVGAFSNALGSFKIEQGKPATQIVGLDGDRGVVQLGDAEPKFQMSFYNDLTIYKNVNLSFVLHWKQGGQNINLTELLTDLGGTSPDYDGDDNGNGISNAAERISSLGVSATPFVQNANYLRLRDVGLYYSFPANLIKNAFNSVVSNVRIGVSATNLFTITPYKSYDPEVSNFGASGFSTAVDVTPYPSARRMFFHLSVDF